MPIRVVCPTCAKSLTAPDAAAGKQAACPACKTKILVPASGAAAAAPPGVTKPTAPNLTTSKPGTPKPAAPTGANTAPAAAKPTPAPKPTASSPTAAQSTKPPPAPQSKPALQPKSAQPVERLATATPVARTAPLSSASAAQPKRVSPPPPPPPSSATTPVIRPKPPAKDEDEFVDVNDIEIIDEYGISLAPEEPRPAIQRPTALVNLATAGRPPNERSSSDASAEHELSSERRRKSRPQPPINRSSTGPRRFLYLTLALAMIPLAFSLIGDDHSIEERFARTHEAHPEAFPPSLDGGFDLEELLAKLPDHRLLGAHLSRGSWVHWFYALASAGVFLAVAIFLFESGTANPRQLLGVGAATATFGVISLLLVQLAASLTNGFFLRGNIIILIVFYVLKFIAFSYQCALDPENGFLLSFFGYTFGVGLCEELTKATPVLLRMRSPQGIDWRGACVWGLASGVGFGVAEGIMYSSDYYNGIQSAEIYFVRFISCVALHAVWSAAVGLTLWHERNKLAEDLDWKELIVVILIALAGPMILHGLYDTMLKREMQVWALVTALASFVWLAGLIEWTRLQEANEAPPPKKMLRSIRAHQSPILPSE